MGLLAVAVTGAATYYVHDLERVKVAPTEAIDRADSIAVSTYTGLMLIALPGFAMFHAGIMTRREDLRTILITTIGSLALIACLWIAVGYSLAFAVAENHPFIGTFNRVLFLGMKADGASAFAPSIPEFLFAFSMTALALVTASIILESLAEGTRLSALLLFSAGWLLLVYVPPLHWVYGGGFLASAGIIDFAGGLTIHLNAGVAGLVVAFTLGTSQHPFVKPRSQNLPLAAIGLGFIWLGWMGVTGGASLGASSRGTSAMLVTNIAVCVGALTWVGLEWGTRRRPSATGFMFGVVAGLSGITPASGFVSPWHAALIGVLVSAVCFFASHALRDRQSDPRIGVLAAHAVGGAAGTLLTGVFAAAALTAYPDNPGTSGLLEGNPLQLLLQIYGLVVITIWVGLVTFLWLKLLQHFGCFRSEADVD
jgi:Amt family ammonium transporter